MGMRLSNWSHQLTTFLPKKLLVTAPIIKTMASASSTPKPGM